MFITLEGIDGSGKGTQAGLLSKWIRDRGHDTFLTREPTDGDIGKVLRKGLKDGSLEPRTEALLFAADRAEHVKEINRKTDEGKVIISERYLHSSLAYQSASGLSLEWLKEINRFAPEPDLVLVLDITPDVALERVTKRNAFTGTQREHFEKKDFLTRVRGVYLDLAKERDNFAVIDASVSMEDVQTAIRRKVGRLLSDVEAKKKKPRQKGIEEFFG